MALPRGIQLQVRLVDVVVAEEHQVQVLLVLEILLLIRQLLCLIRVTLVDLAQVRLLMVVVEVVVPVLLALLQQEMVLVVLLLVQVVLENNYLVSQPLV